MKRRQIIFRQISLLLVSLTLLLTPLVPIQAEDLREFEIYRDLEVTDPELMKIAEKLLTKDLVGIDLETFEAEPRVEQLAMLYRGLYLDSVIYQDRNLHYFNQLGESREGLSEEQISELQEQLTWFIDAEYILELALKNDLLDDLWGPDFDTIDAAADEQDEIREEAIALRAWVRVHLDQMWDETPSKQRELLGIVIVSLHDPMADLFMNLRPDEVADVVEIELLDSPTLQTGEQAATTESADPVTMAEHFKTKQDLATWVTWLGDDSLGSLPADLLQNFQAMQGKSIARDEKVYGTFDGQGRTLMAEVSGEDVQELIFVVPGGDDPGDFTRAVFKEELKLKSPSTKDGLFREDIYHIRPKETKTPVILTKVTTPLQVILRLEPVQ